MTSRTRACVAAGTSVATALILTACNSASPGTGGAASSAAAVRGGTLNMLGAGDVDYMDPNISYYSGGYLGLRMWSRQLFTNPAVAGQRRLPCRTSRPRSPRQGAG